MKNIRIVHAVGGGLLALLVFFAVRCAILDDREKAAAAVYAQEYVREEYGRQDELAAWMLTGWKADR